MTREEFDKQREEITQKYPDGQIVHKMALAYEYIDSLEQQNTALQVRIKELEELNTCNGCEYSEYNYAHKCETCDRTIRNDYFTPKQNKC